MSEAAENIKYAYRLPPCPAYDVAGTERWLADMAARGLLLAPDGFFLGLATFERREPCAARYRLEAVPKIGMFDESDSPNAEAVDLAAEYGWEYVGRRGEFYVYRTVREDARELNTDPRVQALAMKAVRSRQRWNLLDLLFWLILWPLLQNDAAVYRSPILTAVTLGTWLTLFSIAMISWLCARAVIRAVMLERLYRRLSRGESTVDERADVNEQMKRARHHRAVTVVRALLVTVWIVLLSVKMLHWMSETEEVSLKEYIKAGNDIPFATVQEIAITQGMPKSYRQTVSGWGNTVTAWGDILAPVSIDFCEIAEVTLEDGRVVEGGLYVDYQEAAAPWIAARLAREYHRLDRRDEDYKALELALPEADYAVAYLDALHMQTVVIQMGNRVIHASFHPYSDAVEIPLEAWAAVLARSIQ